MEYCNLKTFNPCPLTYDPNVDTEGDSICIFGFSRGAYTARALAGMLHKVRGSKLAFFPPGCIWIIHVQNSVASNCPLSQNVH